MFDRPSAKPASDLTTESNANDELVDAVQYTRRFLSTEGRIHYVSCTEYFVQSLGLVFNERFAERSNEPHNKFTAHHQEDNSNIKVCELTPVKLPKNLVEKAQALILAQEQASEALKSFGQTLKDFTAPNTRSIRP